MWFDIAEEDAAKEFIFVKTIIHILSETITWFINTHLILLYFI